MVGLLATEATLDLEHDQVERSQPMHSLATCALRHQGTAGPAHLEGSKDLTPGAGALEAGVKQALEGAGAVLLLLHSEVSAGGLFASNISLQACADQSSRWGQRGTRHTVRAALVVFLVPMRTCRYKNYLNEYGSGGQDR